MSKALVLRGSAIAILAMMSCMAIAQDGTSAAAPAVDPDAVAALNKMGAALRATQNVNLHADVTTEEVLTTGQKLQFGGTVDIKAVRPTKLRLDIASERQSRTFYYDGKTATLFAPRIGYFATFPAKPTIAQVLETAADQYGVEFPMSDLFEWGEDSTVAEGLTSAFRVGTDTIKGQVCEQYAMRQQGSDWQVWIRRDGAALPCKLVITTTDDSSMPQYTAVYDWKPAGSFPADTFTFTPPPETRRIAIGQVPTPAAGAK